MPANGGRWRLKDMVRWVFAEFSISPDESTMRRELTALGFRKLSARPRNYAQNGEAIEDFLALPGIAIGYGIAPSGTILALLKR